MAGLKVFSTPKYRLNKLFMQQIGTWPEQSPKARLIVPILYFLVLASVFVPELARMIDVWGQIDYVIESVPPMIVIIIGWAKLINGGFRTKLLLELSQRIQDDWEYFSSSPQSMAILEKHATDARNLTILYAVIFYGAATAFAGFPALPIVLDIVAPLNETRPKKYLFAVEYGVDPEEYYYYILFHAYLTTLACMMIFVTLDTMFAVWIEHCCALFEIVGYKLVHATEKHDAISFEIDRDDDVAYENFRFCIKQHKQALIFANLIESMYSTSAVVSTGGNMLVMSITGVLLVIKLDDFEEAVRYAALTFGQIYHLYYCSMNCQKIIDSSNRISSYAYDSDWSEFSLRAQKLLMLIIARAQKPCLLTAGRVYIINMENYSSMMKTSISYFTVLSSFR